MKKTGFLGRLKLEGKLNLVEPSEEIKQSYIKKSESNIISAKILLENSRLEEAVALSYYSMYHMLTALLFKTGVKSENHAASIILLKGIFGIENSDIAHSKKERVDKQYYVDFRITKEEVINSIKKAEEFNSRILDFISRLTNKDVIGYRKKLKGVVG